MSDVIIIPNNSGPYHVKGKFKIMTDGGREIAFDGDEMGSRRTSRSATVHTKRPASRTTWTRSRDCHERSTERTVPLSDAKCVVAAAEDMMLVKTWPRTYGWVIGINRYIQICKGGRNAMNRRIRIHWFSTALVAALFGYGAVTIATGEDFAALVKRLQQEKPEFAKRHQATARGALRPCRPPGPGRRPCPAASRCRRGCASGCPRT